ncbi:hypothetical protein [Janthinobacterium agaricidamnosum]|nr:hypothetical protein [Janthinobacterium agaricidamnosum]
MDKPAAYFFTGGAAGDLPSEDDAGELTVFSFCALFEEASGDCFVTLPSDADAWADAEAEAEGAAKAWVANSAANSAATILDMFYFL